MGRGSPAFLFANKCAEPVAGRGLHTFSYSLGIKQVIFGLRVYLFWESVVVFVYL
ncbi:unnamed protein product [Trifolium pratense]|uniref:Uncharacterized protein n=1 Tax=Trifolium pratense TaxID=57577 RepID=A0ACB0JMZ5_TRIPR|nr:unnamed protein product [Trifolium pratense]